MFPAVDLKQAKVYEGKPSGKADCTLTLSDEDMARIVSILSQRDH